MSKFYTKKIKMHYKWNIDGIPLDTLDARVTGCLNFDIVLLFDHKLMVPWW
jgi:hypothetical protein